MEGTRRSSARQSLFPRLPDRGCSMQPVSSLPRTKKPRLGQRSRMSPEVGESPREPVPRRIHPVNVSVTYDASADAAYIYLVPIEAGAVATTVPGEDEAGSVNLDFHRDGRLLGIEVLAASRWLPREMIEEAE